MASSASRPSSLTDLVEFLRTHFAELEDGSGPAGGGPPPVAAVEGLGDTLAGYLSAAGETLGTVLREERVVDSLAAYLAERVEDLLLRGCPFLRLAPAEREEFRKLYAGLVRELADALQGGAAGGEALARVGQAHRAALQGFLGGLKDAPLLGRGSPGLPAAPGWAEYRPELQMELLGIDPSRLEEPVLDLGCGPGASLVAHLRGLGIEAFGMDRLLPLPPSAPYLVREDWMETRLGPGSFGTVIAHMSFTLHLVHHHLRGDDACEAHARKYMEILRSLRPGGSFFYAPGLPFLEEHLPPALFTVTRRPLPRDALPPPPASLAGAARMVEPFLYGVRVVLQRQGLRERG